MDATKLEPLMLAAGFIDVTVRTVKCPTGPWGSGTPHTQSKSLMKDRKSQALGRICLDVCAGAYESLVDKLTDEIPNETDREEFAQAMLRDLRNPAYRLHHTAYVSLRVRIMQIDLPCRYVVTGRKPPVKT